MARNGKLSGTVKMDDWNDWFENCGVLVPYLQKLEACIFKYLSFVESKKDAGVVEQRYASHHSCDFYKEDGIFPKSKIKQLLISALIGCGVGVLLSLVLFIMSASKKSGNSAFSMSSLVIFGVIGLFVGGAIYFLAVFLRLLAMRSGIDRQQEALMQRIGFIPPKYRNSIALDFVYTLYLNYSGVLTFSTAFDSLDEWFTGLDVDSAEYIGRMLSVMFDVPYNSDSSNSVVGSRDIKRSTNLSASDGPTDIDFESNPALPTDIGNKTFKGIPDADAKLKSLIGLTDVKQQVAQMKNRMEFSKSTSGARDKVSGNHMCFLGSPGTGKTTIARIITRMLYDFGYIKEDKCVEVDGGYFKSPYTGQTSARTQAIIDYAMGGVLFIDEAYLMMDENSGVGTEATGTLLKNMEDHQSDFVVIFAGYEDSTNRLLNTNEGFASRIKYKVYFQDFTIDELMQIFDMYLTTYSDGVMYDIDSNAREMVKKQFLVELDSPMFGNARVVRNAFDMILDFHADNFMSHRISEDKKFTFVVDDIEKYIEVRTKQLDEDNRNYIASQGIDNSIVSFTELKGRTKPGVKDPDKALSALAGLDVVKNEIKEMKAQFEFYDGDMGSTEGHHMCFMGPAGTGKSTVAAIMTSYLYEMGIIRRNEYLDINGDFLKGMYLGHTGKRTQAVVNYCQGMVLFLDEAYLLYNGDSGDNYGQEAIGVLLDAMEKNRKSFVVIFAGYDKEMDDFLNANSGLRSRISQTFHFERYSPHELAQMMNRLAKKDKFTVNKDVWVPVQKYVSSQFNDPYFGNARFIRSFWQEVKKQHIVNYADSGDESQKYVISLKDVNDTISKMS